MKKFMMLLSLVTGLAAVGPVTNTITANENDELQVVDYVDLERYLGTWYEVAAIPQWFQRDCLKSTAEYSLKEPGKIRVINRCTTEDGEKKVKGKAWVTDETTNAKLKVQFFWPFSGNYWIIELDSDYRFAVVGEPEREALWILSREPVLEPEILEDLLDQIEYIHGYDRNKIVIKQSFAPLSYN